MLYHGKLECLIMVNVCTHCAHKSCIAIAHYLVSRKSTHGWNTLQACQRGRVLFHVLKVPCMLTAKFAEVLDEQRCRTELPALEAQVLMARNTLNRKMQPSTWSIANECSPLAGYNTKPPFHKVLTRSFLYTQI